MPPPLRVLLVDDSPEFLESTARFLATWAKLALVGRATSGRQALELASQLQPDLVLIDLAMPGMNGLEVTRQLKSLAVPPKVVIMTFYEIAEYREAAKAVAADGFISKSSLRTQLFSLFARIFNLPDFALPYGYGR
jgi:DNA-binding NarL/FixJ family response regulator